MSRAERAEQVRVQPPKRASGVREAVKLSQSVEIERDAAKAAQQDVRAWLDQWEAKARR
jgi:hypothetical protein